MIDIYEDSTPGLHGYAVANIARIAHAAVRQAQRRAAARIRDPAELRAAARCAVLAELRQHQSDPGIEALMRAADRALKHEIRREWANRGFNERTGELRQGYVRYWQPGPGPGLDEHIAESMGTRQIFATLTPRQQEICRVLVECDGDQKVAAARLGIKPGAVSGHLQRIRPAFLALWHEHETPQAVNWRRGRTYAFTEEAAEGAAERARAMTRVREGRREATRWRPAEVTPQEHEPTCDEGSEATAGDNA